MTAIDRRTLITAAALSGLAAPAAAATLGQSIPVPQGFTRFPIWKGPAPGGEKVTVKEEEALRKPDGPADDSFFAHIVTPTLTMLRPARPNGAAMLLIPGGGYTRVAIGHEGYAIARRFAEAGYTCFVLLYRLPADGWAAGADAPLQDAQRALRVIRSLAPREQFSPERIGVIGFSAGGHLAAWLSTRAPRETYAPRDAIDREPLNLSVAGLMYPVIMMEGPDRPQSFAGAHEGLFHEHGCDGGTPSRLPRPCAGRPVGAARKQPCDARRPARAQGADGVPSLRKWRPWLWPAASHIAGCAGAVARSLPVLRTTPRGLSRCPPPRASHCSSPASST
jgi:acetyl esterase/lipase